MLSTIAEFFFNGDSANIGDRPSGIDGFLTGLPGRSLANTAVLSMLGAYSYICVLPDEFLLKSTVMTTDFKRNSSGRTRIYEYTPPQLTL